MNPLKALNFIGSALSHAQNVRSKIIGDANQLAAAIVGASAFTVARLNQALQEKNRKAKVDTLIGLTDTEIAAFVNMNNFCAKIYSSANALSRWTTNESANIKITGKKDAEQLTKNLIDAEMGMQKLFNDHMSKPAAFDKMTDAQLEAWTKDAIQKASNITAAANKAVRKLSEVI